MRTFKMFTLLLSVLLICSCTKEEDNTPITNVEFLPTLSQLNLFQGDLSDLEPNESVYKYELQTPLFSDYSEKLRFIFLPQGKTLQYNGDGFPIFPEKTLLTKTFYYYNDVRDPSLGKKIIETRVLMKLNGIWEYGNYIWNQEQTEAYLDVNGEGNITPVNYIDNFGNDVNLNYEIPNNDACLKCHQINSISEPIGPKIRNLNVDNQLEYFASNGLITNLPSTDQIEKLPIWNDVSNYTLQQRARAYLDVNCAHCHQSGGYYNINHIDRMDYRYELDLAETDIEMARYFILLRMNLETTNNGFMPETGTTIKHEEGYRLISEFVESL